MEREGLKNEHTTDVFISTRLLVFYKKGVLRIFAKFTRKRQQWGLFYVNLGNCGTKENTLFLISSRSSLEKCLVSIKTIGVARTLTNV